MAHRTRLTLLVVCALVIGVFAAFWISMPPSRDDMLIDADSPQVVARGQKIYAAECAACHGANLEGQANWRLRLPNGRLPAPPHDPSGHTWHHPDAQLFAMTKYGVAALVGGDYESDMPAYADLLTDAEILAVLAYIKSTWPPAIRARHEQINDSYRQQAESMRGAVR